MAKVIGTVVYFMKNYIIDNLGKEALDNMEFDDDVRQVLNSPVQSGTWYDVKVFEQILENLQKKYGRQEIKKSSELAAEKQLQFLFGLISTFVSPQRIFKNAQIMWRKCYDEGTLSILEYEESKVVLQVSGFTFTDPFRYGEEIFFKAFIEIVTRKKVITTHSKSIDDTTTQFSYTMR